jgi:type VI secretion system secreted protein VgrG
MGLIQTTIQVEGRSIKQFSSFTLSQSIYQHHQFRLVCPTEAIDGTSALFHSSKDLIGGTIKVQIADFSEKTMMQFSGLVTQIESIKHSGHAGDIVLTGYSPTIILDHITHCESFEKNSLGNIAKEVLSKFPQNLINPSISPEHRETLAYTVQYKEAAWQFLRRLCATFGEWLYYDGQKLIIGSPKGKQVELSYGSSMFQFSMGLELRAFNFQMKAYDYLKSDVYSSTTNEAGQKAGVDGIGQLVYKKSEQFFGTAAVQWHNHFLTSQKQLSDYTSARGAAQVSNMVRVSGSSDNLNLQLGGTVSLKDSSVYSEGNTQVGNFTIISLSHHFDGQGNYANDFIAIPGNIKTPPVTNYTEPLAETQTALVTDNFDPKGLGRVKVRFRWMPDNSQSPWLRITRPYSGKEKGTFFTPEVGEEVIVGFEGDSPTKPFVLGTVYHEKEKSGFGDKENNIKAIQTRSGNKVIMNDKEGSIFIEDKDKNSIKLDGEGNIDVLANQCIVLTCGESKIEMKKDGTIDITGKKITVNATDNAKMGSGSSSFTADGKGNEAKMAGMKTNINGSMEASMKGGTKTEVTASGNVAVKGALITLN